jgi:hypothetical protein
LVLDCDKSSPSLQHYNIVVRPRVGCSGHFGE